MENSRLQYWEHFAHGADIGVRGVAPSLAGAFEQAALALTAVVTEPAGLNHDELVEVACEAPDLELLLVDWLNALIYEMVTRRLVFRRFEVRLDGGQLRAMAWGQSIESPGIELAVEPKGATYTALHVGQRPDGHWVAQCVVDV
jgi:tRNA nucleotidyltransferase (CCA-adding enzyme)